MSEDRPVQCANWSNYLSKAAYLEQVMIQHPDLEWWWIDDEVQSSAQEIQARQLPAHRCIHVCPDGPGELVVLKDIMQSRLVPATTFENVQTRRA